MPIVSSAIVEASPQRDSRIRVRERHVDHLGIPHEITYAAEPGFNLASALAAHAPALETSLRSSEIQDNIDSIVTLGAEAVVTRKHSNVGLNVIALRERYRSSTRGEAVMLGDYLAGLTDVQLQAAFGLTAPQVTALRTLRLTPAAAQAAAIRAAAGE